MKRFNTLYNNNDICKKNNMKYFVLVILGICFLTSGCKREGKIVKFGGEAQGTYYAITYCADNNENLQPAVDSLLKQFDKSVSAYVPTSILSRLNNNDSNN